MQEVQQPSAVEASGKFVLVKRVNTSEVTKGGIVIPRTADEVCLRGEVVSIGQRVFDETKLDFKVGDHILYNKYMGAVVEMEHEKLTAVKAEEIFGVVRE
jgi:chaperonin GroES